MPSATVKGSTVSVDATQSQALRSGFDIVGYRIHIRNEDTLQYVYRKTVRSPKVKVTLKRGTYTVWVSYLLVSDPNGATIRTFSSAKKTFRVK